MKLKEILITGIILTSLFFVSCEKEEVSMNDEICPEVSSNSSASDYVIINPNWEVLDKSYSDANGNVGVLYVNSKNPIEKQFVISKESKTEPKKWTGTYQTKTVTNPNGQSTVEYSCDKSEASNCRWEITTNEQGVVVSAEIVLKTK